VISQPSAARSDQLVLFACIFFAAATLAACTSAAPSGAALTKEELSAQGNAICAAGNEKMDAAMPDWSQGEPAAPTAEAFYNTVTSEVTTMIEGLRGLTPPAEVEADYAAMLTEADAALAQIKADGLEAFLAQEEDPFAAANEIANKIGLTVCGQSD
jgi:hypothetical protein